MDSLINAIGRKWREGKVRPIQGNSPHDRPVSRGTSSSSRRICDDPFPATPLPPRYTIRGPQFAFFRHGGIYRSDVGSKPKVKPKHLKPGRGRAASRWSAPAQVKERVGRNHAPLIVRDEFRPAIP